jgi:hypothetical protein
MPNAEKFRHSGMLTQENPSLAQEIMPDGNFLLDLYNKHETWDLYMYYNKVCPWIK